MLSACLTGIFGSFITYWLGTRYFGFDLKDWATALGVTNFAGFTSLLLTLALERRPAIRRILMGNAPKTWGVLAILYTAILAGMDPTLRNPVTLAVLWLPLILCTGFMIPFWGPTQDRVLRWEHRQRARKAQPPVQGSNQEFAGPERDVIRVES